MESKVCPKWGTDVRHEAPYWKTSNLEIVKQLDKLAVLKNLINEEVTLIDIESGSGFSSTQIISQFLKAGVKVKKLIGIDLPENCCYKNVLGRLGLETEFISADLDTEEGLNICRKVVKTYKNAWLLNINGISYLHKSSQNELLKILCKNKSVLVTLLGEHSQKNILKEFGFKGVWNNMFASMPKAGMHIIKENLINKIESVYKKNISKISYDDIQNYLKVNKISQKYLFLLCPKFTSEKNFKYFDPFLKIKFIIKGIKPMLMTYATMGKAGSRGYRTTKKEMNSMLKELGCEKYTYIQMRHGVGMYIFGLNEN